MDKEFYKKNFLSQLENYSNPIKKKLKKNSEINPIDSD